MARIRSIKPDFWSSEQVMECSLNARLLFIGLWNFCDDAGRHPLRLRQIKAQVFPGDDLALETIHGMLSELSVNGLIHVYEVDGNVYFQVSGWRHQKINRPQADKYPAPEKGRPVELSETFTADSLNAPGTLTPDRIGREGRRIPCGDTAASRPSTSALSNGSAARKDAQAPLALPPEDDPDPIFGTGLAFLVRKGAKERSARSFLGLLRKEVGDLQVCELLAAAERDDVSEPLAWLRKAAQARGSPGRGRGTAWDGLDTRVDDALRFLENGRDRNESGGG